MADTIIRFKRENTLPVTVQYCFPIAPTPLDQLPAYTINGVHADIFPVARTDDDNIVNVVQAVATLPVGVGTGWSTATLARVSSSPTPTLMDPSLAPWIQSSGLKCGVIFAHDANARVVTLNTTTPLFVFRHGQYVHDAVYFTRIPIDSANPSGPAIGVHAFIRNYGYKLVIDVLVGNTLYDPDVVNGAGARGVTITHPEVAGRVWFKYVNMYGFATDCKSHVDFQDGSSNLGYVDGATAPAPVLVSSGGKQHLLPGRIEFARHFIITRKTYNSVPVGLDKQFYGIAMAQLNHQGNNWVPQGDDSQYGKRWYGGLHECIIPPSDDYTYTSGVPGFLGIEHEAENAYASGLSAIADETDNLHYGEFLMLYGKRDGWFKPYGEADPVGPGGAGIKPVNGWDFHPMCWATSKMRLSYNLQRHATALNHPITGEQVQPDHMTDANGNYDYAYPLYPTYYMGWHPQFLDINTMANQQVEAFWALQPVNNAWNNPTNPDTTPVSTNKLIGADGGYTTDMEINTSAGWIPIASLTTVHTVATRDSLGNIVYQSPYIINQRTHSGTVVYIPGYLKCHENTTIRGQITFGDGSHSYPPTFTLASLLYDNDGNSSTANSATLEGATGTSVVTQTQAQEVAYTGQIYLPVFNQNTQSVWVRIAGAPATDGFWSVAPKFIPLIQPFVAWSGWSPYTGTHYIRFETDVRPLVYFMNDSFAIWVAMRESNFIQNGMAERPYNTRYKEGILGHQSPERIISDYEEYGLAVHGYGGTPSGNPADSDPTYSVPYYATAEMYRGNGHPTNAMASYWRAIPINWPTAKGVSRRDSIRNWANKWAEAVDYVLDPIGVGSSRGAYNTDGDGENFPGLKVHWREMDLDGKTGCWFPWTTVSVGSRIGPLESEISTDPAIKDIRFAGIKAWIAGYSSLGAYAIKQTFNPKIDGGPTPTQDKLYRHIYTSMNQAWEVREEHPLWPTTSSEPPPYYYMTRYADAPGKVYGFRRNSSDPSTYTENFYSNQKPLSRIMPWRFVTDDTNNVPSNYYPIDFHAGEHRCMDYRCAEHIASATWTDINKGINPDKWRERINIWLDFNLPDVYPFYRINSTDPWSETYKQCMTRLSRSDREATIHYVCIAQVAWYMAYGDGQVLTTVTTPIKTVTPTLLTSGRMQITEFVPFKEQLVTGNIDLTTGLIYSIYCQTGNSIALSTLAETVSAAGTVTLTDPRLESSTLASTVGVSVSRDDVDDVVKVVTPLLRRTNTTVSTNLDTLLILWCPEVSPGVYADFSTAVPVVAFQGGPIGLTPAITDMLISTSTGGLLTYSQTYDPVVSADKSRVIAKRGETAQIPIRLTEALSTDTIIKPRILLYPDATVGTYFEIKNPVITIPAGSTTATINVGPKDPDLHPAAKILVDITSSRGASHDIQPVTVMYPSSGNDPNHVYSSGLRGTPVVDDYYDYEWRLGQFLGAQAQVPAYKPDGSTYAPFLMNGLTIAPAATHFDDFWPYISNPVGGSVPPRVRFSASSSSLHDFVRQQVPSMYPGVGSRTGFTLEAWIRPAEATPGVEKTLLEVSQSSSPYARSFRIYQKPNVPYKFSSEIHRDTQGLNAQAPGDITSFSSAASGNTVTLTFTVTNTPVSVDGVYLQYITTGNSWTTPTKTIYKKLSSLNFVSGTTYEFTFTGLAFNSSYDFRVRSQSFSNVAGSWATPVTQSTASGGNLTPLLISAGDAGGKIELTLQTPPTLLGGNSAWSDIFDIQFADSAGGLISTVPTSDLRVSAAAVPVNAQLDYDLFYGNPSDPYSFQNMLAHANLDPTLVNGRVIYARVRDHGFTTGLSDWSPPFAIVMGQPAGGSVGSDPLPSTSPVTLESAELSKTLSNDLYHFVYVIDQTAGVRFYVHKYGDHWEGATTLVDTSTDPIVSWDTSHILNLFYSTTNAIQTQWKGDMYTLRLTSGTVPEETLMEHFFSGPTTRDKYDEPIISLQPGSGSLLDFSELDYSATVSKTVNVVRTGGSNTTVTVPLTLENISGSKSLSFSNSSMVRTTSVSTTGAGTYSVTIYRRADQDYHLGDSSEVVAVGATKDFETSRSMVRAKVTGLTVPQVSWRVSYENLRPGSGSVTLYAVIRSPWITDITATVELDSSSTAVLGQDFTLPTPLTITIPAGQTTGSFVINL